MEEGLLTVNQASKKFNVHPQTIRNWYRSGILPHYRPNPRGKVFIKQLEIDAIMGEKAGSWGIGDNGKKV